MKLISTLLLTCALGSPETPETTVKSAVAAKYRAGFEAIRLGELRAWLELLAAPELEGRDTGERGYDIASRYVASVMRSLDVEPGGDNGTYYQSFQMVRRRWDLEAARLHVTTVQMERVEGEGEKAVEKTASEPLLGRVAIASPKSVDWRGPYFFVGTGLGAVADSPDPYHGLALGEETVVVIVPRKDSDQISIDSAIESARAKGLRRLLIVSDRRVQQRVGMRLRYYPRDRVDREPRDADGLEVVYIRKQAVQKLFAACGLNIDEMRKTGKYPASRWLHEVSVALTIDLETTETPTQNVVGIIPGGDPKLKHEAVVVGAHLDHVGVDHGETFYGADDNASGCVATLGVAKGIFANGVRPRRSVILIFFGAEEKGLHGSRYWVDNPSVPIENVVMMINLDMVGRNEEHRERKNRKGEITQKAETAAENVNSMHVVGWKRRFLGLVDFVNRVNAPIGLELEEDEERVWRRSDHFNFAEKGVPVVFFFAGFHPDYHRSTDTPEKINYPKLTKVTRLAFSLAFEIADRVERLRNHRL